MSSILARWGKRIVSLLLGGTALSGMPANASAATPSIDERIAAVRVELGSQSSQISHPPFEQGNPLDATAVAQWGNWNNWANWANWSNWGNWGNWLNWLNG